MTSSAGAQRNRMLDAALRYAQAGIAVVPIVPGKKYPLTEHGAKDASADPEQITAWWRAWPDAWLALACGEVSGFDVLDVDEQHGGIDSLDAIIKEHGPLPETLRQDTPSLGFHLFFRHDPTLNLKNWSGGQGNARAGLDCRTTNTMVRTAPVPGYKWTSKISLADLPPWPIFLAEMYQKVEHPKPSVQRCHRPVSNGRQHHYVAAIVKDLASKISAAAPGSQNATLNAQAFYAGTVHAAIPSYSGDLIIEELVAAGMRMSTQTGKDPWRTHEVRTVVRHGFDDGVRAGPADLPILRGRGQA